MGLELICVNLGCNGVGMDLNFKNGVRNMEFLIDYCAVMLRLTSIAPCPLPPEMILILKYTLLLVSMITNKL